MPDDYPDIVHHPDMVLVSAFWECECDDDYVHFKEETLYCDRCGMPERECPDARIEGVVRWLNERYGSVD